MTRAVSRVVLAAARASLDAAGDTAQPKGHSAVLKGGSDPTDNVTDVLVRLSRNRLHGCT